MPEQKIAYHLSFSDVIRILRLVDENPFEELQLEMEGLKLHVVQDKHERSPTQPSATKAPVSEIAPAAVPEPVREPLGAAVVPAKNAQIHGTPVLAPLAGTFYRAPSPGALPYVEVGSAVKEGGLVGILEIMKLMNHVTAPCAGVISEIRAQNEEFVEFGQVLAVIDPERVG